LYAGPVKLKAEAHDNVEVTNAEFKDFSPHRGLVSLGSTGLSTTDTFSVIWNAPAVTVDEYHVLSAVAYDRAGNRACDSAIVLFSHLTPPGAVAVTTTPPGAQIWLDGNNTGRVSPATIESIATGTHQVMLTLPHYTDRDTTVQVHGGQTTRLSNSLWGDVVVAGTVAWPGHRLDKYCVALLDTSRDGHGADILYGPVNPATGAFSLVASLSTPDTAYVMGFDDVNDDCIPDHRDGQGFWDRAGKGKMTTADMVPLVPGDTISNVQIVLVQIP
jgi:hypothetical protein